jgi:beta-lactam-binding protein with PASTA domain
MTNAPLPDVVALPLDEALRVLGAAGWPVTVIETGPPNATPEGDGRRVLRQRMSDEGRVVITTAAERYVRPPRRTGRRDG